MNVSKLLLFDATFLIAAIPFLILIHGGNKKNTILRSSNKDDLLRNSSIKLPEKEELIELEKIVASQGSHIKFGFVSLEFSGKVI